MGKQFPREATWPSTGSVPHILKNMACDFFCKIFGRHWFNSCIAMDKQRDLSGGELSDTMKNGEGTGVEGERGLAVFRVVGGVFRGGSVDCFCNLRTSLV